MNKKDVKLYRLLFLFIAGVPIISGCASSLTQAGHNSISQVVTNVVAAGGDVPDSQIRGVVVKNSDHGWISTTANMGKGLLQLSFADENRGWAVGKNSIYATSDGNSWNVINSNINLLKKQDVEDVIVKFEFSKDGVGWLVLQHSAADEFSLKDQIVVYRSLDSGKTWNLSLSQASATFSNLRSSGRDAWLVGKTFLGNNPQRLVPLILYFSDSRKKWENLSRTFDSYLKNQSHEDFNFPYISKVDVTDDGCSVIATEQRTIFQTCDFGKRWNLINSHEIADRPMSINQITVSDNTLNLLESTGGAEGTGTLLTTFDFPQGKTQRTISLSPYFLTNASWVSESEIIVAGELEGNPLQDAAESERKRRDVILHTIDGGKTWSEVFSSPFDYNRGNFFFAGSRTIWLIDENGVVHRIAKP